MAGNRPHGGHYIPEFYLAGFASTGTPDGELWVLDIEKKTQRRGKARSEAIQKDFYRLNIPSGDPFMLEKKFAELEGKAAAAIKQLIQLRQLPSGGALNDLLHHVALLAARVPARREAIAGPMEDVGEQILRLVVATKESYEAQLTRMKSAGKEFSSIPYREMRRAVEEGSISVKMSRNWHLEMLLRMAATILDLIRLRNWSLLIAAPDAGFFICSDNPVALQWKEPMPLAFPPGFGMDGTILTVPLTKSMALWGSFEGCGVMEVNRLWVATVNFLTAQQSSRFLYSPLQEFTILGREKHEIIHARDLLGVLSEKKEEGSSESAAAPQ